MPYTPFGPWTNGSPPGMDQAFLSNLEAFLQSVNGVATDGNLSSNGAGIVTLLGLIANGGIRTNPTPITINGATSGTAALYQPLTGTFKFIFINQQNMRNNSASSQFIAFPVPFTSCLWIASGSNNSFQLLSGGTPISIQVISTLGSQNGGTTIGSDSIANAGACDTIAFLGSQSTSHTGPVVLFGI